MRKDHEASIEKWKDSKTQLEDLILSVRRQSSGKDAEIERMHLATSKEREQYKQEINELKTENAEKTNSFAEAMNKIQTMSTFRQERKWVGTGARSCRCQSLNRLWEKKTRTAMTTHPMDKL